MSDYTFHTLSDVDFEVLVGDLLNADGDLDLHSYPAGRDQGIDLMQQRPDGYRIVVQCKHYVRSDRSKLIAAAKEEARKRGRRDADRYIFVTSGELTAAAELEIMRVLEIPQHDMWGRRRLNAALARNPEVERRHLKLWLSSVNILRSIIDAGCWNRSFAMLSRAAERARLWVETPVYRHALDVLEREGVCVLIGAPGVGKSYLAEIIALQYARAGWRIIDVSHDIGAAWRELGPDDGLKLFLLPDPLGEVDLSPWAMEDANDIHAFVRTIAQQRDSGKRLVVTTPTQVLRSAIQTGSTPLRRFAGDSRYQCDVSVEEWDDEARKRLLLNHLQFAGIEEDERRLAERDRRSMSIVRHRSFNPRLIELVCEDLTPGTTADEALRRLLDALAVPEIVWTANWAKLSEEASNVVLTLATLKPRPVALSELRNLTPHAGGARRWGDLWRSLEPIWITVGGPATDRSVTLANPGLRDFLLSKLEDIDMAGELVDRCRTLEQLEELSRAAGDLVPDVQFGPPARRPVLAHALRQRSAEISRRVKEYTDVELRHASLRTALRTLRTAVALLVLYGGPDVVDWVAERVSRLLAGGESVPVVAGLALAARSRHLPDRAARDEFVGLLCTAALTNIQYLDDLDALETYAGELDLDLTEADVPIREIVEAELDHLLDESDPDLIRRRAREMRARAALYGKAIDIRAYLDHAAEAEFR